MTKGERKQINIRADDEMLEAIGEIQVAEADPTAPSVAEVIRQALFEKRDRLRKAAERRK